MVESEQLSLKHLKFCVSCFIEDIWNERSSFTRDSEVPEYNALRDELNQQLKAKYVEVYTKIKRICQERFPSLKLEQFKQQVTDNMEKIKQFCLYNQRVDENFKQTDPRTFNIDQFAPLMLNPNVEPDH